nr:MAG TPA: hypothetical protein [Caudoviricetes sp.]
MWLNTVIPSLATLAAGVVANSTNSSIVVM